MLTPEQLQELPNKILDIYDRLELAILVLLARSLEKLISKEEPEKAVLSAQNAAIRMLVLQCGRQAKNEIKRTVKKAVAIVNKAGVKETKIVNMAVRNIAKEFNEINASLPFVCKQNLLSTLFEVTTKASIETLSTKKTYEKAISDGIQKLAHLGLTLKKKNGAREHLDVVVRRHVMTYTNRAAAQISFMNMLKLGLKYVEVSAHAGARNKGTGWQNHESWQGQVYEVKDMEKAVKIAMLPRPIGYNV